MTSADDVYLGVLVALMYALYATDMRLRRGIFGMTGYIMLLLAKTLETKAYEQKVVTHVRRLAYILLLGTPSYTESRDMFAAAGLVLALSGRPQTLPVLLAMYYALGMPAVVDKPLLFVLRGCFALFISLSAENPLAK